MMHRIKSAAGRTSSSLRTSWLSPKLSLVLASRQRTATIITSTSSRPDVPNLLSRLRRLDTSSLCDAAKATPGIQETFHVLNPRIQRLNNNSPTSNSGDDSRVIMAGIVRTVRMTEPNDFLPVLRGLDQGQPNEVLVVHTCQSQHAVAGELFAREANRRGMMGIVILDGPMRDVHNIREATTSTQKDVVPCYAPFTTPYSGTIQSVGEMQVSLPHDVVMVPSGTSSNKMATTVPIHIEPNQVIVGDEDGIVVGPEETFHIIVDKATEIMKTEEEIIRRMGPMKRFPCMN